LELIQVALSEPAAVAWLAGRVDAAALEDPPLRTILQACYDLHAQGQSPAFANLMVRLEDPAVRTLASDLIALPALRTPELDPLSEGLRPAPWAERLERLVIVLQGRRRREQLRGLEQALAASDQHSDPEAYRALELEYRRLLTSGRTRRA
jgi:DNA primase